MQWNNAIILYVEQYNMQLEPFVSFQFLGKNCKNIPMNGLNFIYFGLNRDLLHEDQ